MPMYFEGLNEDWSSLISSKLKVFNLQSAWKSWGGDFTFPLNNFLTRKFYGEKKPTNRFAYMTKGVRLMGKISLFSTLNWGRSALFMTTCTPWSHSGLQWSLSRISPGPARASSSLSSLLYSPFRTRVIRSVRNSSDGFPSEIQKYPFIDHIWSSGTIIRNENEKLQESKNDK